MELIEPEVELLSELDITPESHIARCARVCYGREYKEPNQEADKKLVEGLIKRGHLSMLRHASMYLSHIEDISQIATHIANSCFWNYDVLHGYASTKTLINSRIATVNDFADDIFRTKGCAKKAIRELTDSELNEI